MIEPHSPAFPALFPPLLHEGLHDGANVELRENRMGPDSLDRENICPLLVFSSDRNGAELTLILWFRPQDLLVCSFQNRRTLDRGPDRAKPTRVARHHTAVCIPARLPDAQLAR